MAARRPPEELLQLEVRELTDLLRHADSFAGFRDTLAAKGIPASAAILAGLIDGEDERRLEAILTPRQECVLFETARDDSLIRWEIIDDPRTLGSAVIIDRLQSVVCGGEGLGSPTVQGQAAD